MYNLHATEKQGQQNFWLRGQLGVTASYFLLLWWFF